MNKHASRYGIIIVTMGIGLLLGGAACSTKSTERFKDAPISSRNSGGATVGTMPDGFSNWAAKCDGKNKVYVLFHEDSPYGGLAVVPNDPTCIASAG